jgi:putative membrane protein
MTSKHCFLNLNLNQMTNQSLAPSESKYKKLIIALSVVIPIAVAVLFQVKIPGYNFSFLPPIYASINGLTAVLLLIALWAIKNGKVKLHETLTRTCLALSAAFLVMYVLYHITSDSTSFGGEGFIRGVYFFILISHISLSVVIIPLVLFTFARALDKNFVQHRKLAKITFPIWLYVAVTGVVVYVMISPYY